MFLSATGCIGLAGVPTGQRSQALIEEAGDDEGGGDFAFGDTYQDSDFQNVDSVVQGDVATEPMEEITVTATRLPSDPDIEALNLSSSTTEIAYQLRDQYPTIRFTSGRRDIARQARAMAANVVRDRQWIARTYRDTPLRNALQQWVNDHPGATQAQIEAGLLSVFNAASPADVASFSSHLSGDAFDVQPVDGALGDAIHDDLAALPGRFLDHEGSLRRWHYQR